MKLLIVTTAFYPEQAIGSVRISKLAKYLHAAGDELTIISLKPAEWAVHDESLRFPGLEELEWVQIGQGTAFSRTLGRLRTKAVGARHSSLADRGKVSNEVSILRRIRLFLISSLQFMFTFAKAIDWVIQVRRFARTHLAGRKFDAIITSYPSLGSPFAGVTLRKMGLSNHLLIDFRDPVSYGEKARLSMRGAVERYLLAHCSIASFVSEGVMQKVLSGAGQVPKNSIIVPNGYDSDDVAVSDASNIARDVNVLCLCYVGSLYGGKRDLRPIFRALSEMIRANRLSRDEVALYYAGRDGEIFRVQAAAEGLEGLVTDHGSVTRAASLDLQRHADICLLATWNTPQDQGILTGKMFEFFMLRKPVLAIVNGTLTGSETRSVMEMVNAGFCLEEADSGFSKDSERLKGWLLSCFEKKKRLGYVPNSYNVAAQQYNFEYVTDCFRDAIAELS